MFLSIGIMMTKLGQCFSSSTGPIVEGLSHIKFKICFQL